jgi:biopolymer transport protein ExbB
MKKLIAFLTIAGMLVFAVSSTTFAQDEDAVATDTTVVDTTIVVEVAQPESPVTTLEDEPVETQGFHQVLKQQFIEGNAMFMSFVLLALIFGLAICIERIIYLNLSTTNTKKLLNKVETAVETGGVEAAKEVCKDTRGPVASIFFQGLTRYDDGLAEV